MTKQQQKQNSKKLTYEEVMEVVKKIEKKLAIFQAKNPSSHNERLLRYQ